MRSETDFKRWLRAMHKGWSEAYEPGRGSGVGYPDLQFLVSHGIGIQPTILPVEVKLGIIRKERIYPSRIRPSQIAWHDRLWRAGGISVLLMCYGVDKRHMYAWALPSVTGDVTSRWKEGYLLSDCIPVVAKGEWCGGSIAGSLRALALSGGRGYPPGD